MVSRDARAVKVSLLTTNQYSLEHFLLSNFSYRFPLRAITIPENLPPPSLGNSQIPKFRCASAAPHAQHARKGRGRVRARPDRRGMTLNERGNLMYAVPDPNPTPRAPSARAFPRATSRPSSQPHDETNPDVSRLPGDQSGLLRDAKRTRFGRGFLSTSCPVLAPTPAASTPSRQPRPAQLFHFRAPRATPFVPFTGPANLRNEPTARNASPSIPDLPPFLRVPSSPSWKLRNEPTPPSMPRPYTGRVRD